MGKYRFSSKMSSLPNKLLRVYRITAENDAKNGTDFTSAPLITSGISCRSSRSPPAPYPATNIIIIYYFIFGDSFHLH